MKILVTGSSGFIGSNLVSEMARGGDHEVYGVDLKRVHPMSSYAVTRHFQKDLQGLGSFKGVLDEVKPDAVVHLAAQVGRLFGEADLVHTTRTNAVMTTVVAHACGDVGVKLLYASTSEVYGDNAETLCDEYDGPFCLPHNLYGLSKRWGEEVCRLYAPDGLVMMRFSMPYGPGVPPGRGRAALPNMLWQAHNRLAIPVHRGSERSWCWIGDTVRAVRLILEADAIGPFNIGRDDDALPMTTVARLACATANAPKDLIHEVEPPGAQTVVKRLSTKRLRDELGWEPEMQIEDGMIETYSWVQNFDAKGDWING